MEFYTGVLGMQLIADFHFEQWKFSVYFLAYVKPENIPEDPTAKMAFLWNQPACLELTHNHGSGKSAKPLLIGQVPRRIRIQG